MTTSKPLLRSQNQEDWNQAIDGKISALATKFYINSKWIALDSNQEKQQNQILPIHCEWLTMSLRLHWHPILIFFLFYRPDLWLFIQETLEPNLYLWAKPMQAAVSCKTSQLPGPRGGWLACLCTMTKHHLSLLKGTRDTSWQYLMGTKQCFHND